MVTVTCKRLWYTTTIIDGRAGGTIAPKTKIWEAEPLGQHPPLPAHTQTHTLVPENTYRWIWHWWILPVSSTTSELFCPKMTQELPKKHYEAGLPEQAWNNCPWMHCHKSIADTLDTACEDWKEVCLCQLKCQRYFGKFEEGYICMWLNGRWAPQCFKKCPFPLNRVVPSIEETDWTKIMWTFFQDQILCPLKGGVPWIEVSQRRGSTVMTYSAQEKF